MLKTNPIKQLIFIDWSNVYIYAKTKFRVRIDPLKLCETVSEDGNVIQKNYFSAEDPNNTGQKNFHDGLKKLGFFVNTHELKEIPGKVFCPNCRHEIECISSY
jgi:hypothetical protein